MQMMTVKTVGAVSSEAAEWYAMDWPAINRNVRRLQVRIVQATKEGRWGKVQALQRLLTHSYSGKVHAVRRVTENTGKKTPGVTGSSLKRAQILQWETAHQAIQGSFCANADLNSLLRRRSSRNLSRQRQAGHLRSHALGYQRCIEFLERTGFDGSDGVGTLKRPSAKD
jgi:hypothetical protein